MPTMQEFLAGATIRAAKAVEEAVLRVPEDKRDWVPMEKGRSALDQAAECAMLGAGVATIIETRTWPADMTMESYFAAKAELAKDWGRIQPMLAEGAEKVAAAIRKVPESDLNVQIQMPWGAQSLAELITYPYWNMSYHEGQINYIASLLGCLE